MAKIRITKSNPPNDNYSDITEFIGKEYEVDEKYFFNEGDTMIAKKGVYVSDIYLDIYEDEYEIIE